MIPADKSKHGLTALVFGLALSLIACGKGIPMDGTIQTNGNQNVSVGISPNLVNQVVSLFKSVFGRQPSSAEIASTSLRLSNGESLANIRSDLANSQESIQDINTLVSDTLGAPNSQIASHLVELVANNGVSFSQLHGILHGTF